MSDLISRQAAIDEIKAVYEWHDVVTQDRLIEHLKEMPSVQPQRQTGKWIHCDGSEHWKCDKCGCRAGYWFNEENSSSWELDMSEWLSDFCPNCGAKMEADKTDGAS